MISFRYTISPFLASNTIDRHHCLMTANASVCNLFQYSICKRDYLSLNNNLSFIIINSINDNSKKDITLQSQHVVHHCNTFAKLAQAHGMHITNYLNDIFFIADSTLLPPVDRKSVRDVFYDTTEKLCR